MGELQQYHTHISAHHNFFDLKLDELFRYRDLVFLFAKRSITVTYTQTVLGPLWLMLNPLLTSIMHTLVFGHIAGIRTSGVPRILFYLCGNAIWGFYAACLKKASGTFVNNAGIFGKVYFPRLAVPLSDVLAEAVKLGIQMLLVLAFLLFYVAQGAVTPCWQAGLLLPLAVFQLGLLAIGVGVLISSMTTKYRDMMILVEFGVNLWMYATPVVYPLSEIRNPLLKTVVMVNPVTMPVEMVRYTMLGVGTLSPGGIALSWGITAACLLLGIMVFHRVERTFMDTV